MIQINMDMPDNCMACKFRDLDGLDCLLNPESNRYATHEEQYKHCPIEEAPDINVGNIDTTTHDSILAETGKNDGDGTSGDCISRTQAIDKFVDGLEEIFADLRERHVDDSVCGLCEYDGAYMGQSGDWCNECPGFDRDDCFKLSDKTRKRWTDEIIKALPSAQPEIIRCKDCVYQTESWSGIKYCEAHGDHIGKDYDYCSNARRKENG